MSDQKIYFPWDNNTLIFGDIDGYKWETTYKILSHVADAIGGAGGYSPDIIDKIEKKLQPDELKKFIRIVCEVNNKIYNETRLVETKSKITVSDIKKTIDKYNIKVNF